MTRQNYYKQTKMKEKQKVNEDLILNLIQNERMVQPRLGGRKLHLLIRTECLENKINLGRDRFFNLLRENNLLVERKKGKPQTTNSRHTLPVFHNLVANVDVIKPNQVWVSDITYIRTMEGFMYAAIITDMYSRKIIGTHIGDSLESYGCTEALRMAVKSLENGQIPIHHSDRGCQYCCHEYVELLDKYKICISMTERNHCYENALAERVNGILKQEYELDQIFRSKEQAKAAFNQAVQIYNTRRPHMSLKYKTPDEVYRRVA